MAGESSTITVSCACGKRLKAPASAAGKKARCPGCGETLIVAAPVEVTELPIEMEAPAPRTITPPPVPMAPQPVLAYQTPAPYMDSGSIWRQDKQVVSHRNTPFPNRCVKCNTPVEQSEMKRKTMYWQHPAWALLVLVNLIIAAIVIMCIRKKTEVYFGLCSVHRAKRRKMILIAWLIALAGIVSFALAIVIGNSSNNSPLLPVAIVAGIVLLIGSLVWALITVPVITIKKIDNDLVWFKGAGDEFLAGLAVQQ